MEKRLAIFLAASLALLTSAYLSVDIVRRWFDASWDEGVTTYFCFSLALSLCGIFITTCRMARVVNWRLIAAILNTFSWLAISNLIDELNGANLTIATVSEYVFAWFGVASGICEYHKITPWMILKGTWSYTLNKTRKLCQRFSGYLRSWRKTQRPR